MTMLPGENEPAPGYDDPLGMLAACHRRIERQLATLDRLQRHLAAHGCDADARAAATGILRYFDTAAPHHHADEEESIFPRLLAADPSARALAGTILGEHAQLAANWQRLRPVLAAVAGGEAAELSAALVAEVRAAYAAHIALEESALIPLAARTFDAATLAMVGSEMAARRGVDPAAPGRAVR
jgi:hemerythrin-like domain-containing protein